tara:strand:- start:26613 stop:27341 length:729 start_codon:yes stop_codon:yes gene_type:complete
MRVNVIIPNFNKAEFLSRCLDSCINQDHKDYKIIFIDNESTDKSLDIAREILSSGNKDYIIDQAKNIYPQCWDECLQKAFDYLDGDYYTIVGSDDFIAETYISSFCGWVKTQKKTILCAQSDLVWIRDNQAIQKTRHQYLDIEDLKSKMLTGCYVNTPSVFYHIDIFKDKTLKREPELYSGAADYEFYFKLLDKNIYIHNINEFIGYYYGINEKQSTWEMHRKTISYDSIIQSKWRKLWNKY